MKSPNDSPKLPQLEIASILFERFKDLSSAYDAESFEVQLGKNVVIVGNMLLNTPKPLSLDGIAEQTGLPFVEMCEAFSDLNRYLSSDGPLRLSSLPDTETVTYLFQVVPTESRELEVTQ